MTDEGPVAPGQATDADLEASTGWVTVAATSALVLGLAQLLPGGPVRALVVGPLVLLLPGHLLLRLLVRSSVALDGALQVVCSVALSVAVILGDALILNLAGAQLDQLDLGLASAASTGLIAAGGIALDVPLPSTMRLLRHLGRPGVAGRRALAAAGGVGVACIAVWVAALAAPAPAAPATVSFSLGPQFAQLPDALTTTPGEQIRIPVVASQDGGTAVEHYELVASVDGRQVSSTPVEVPRTGTWQGEVDVRAPAGPLLHRVALTLVPEQGAGGSHRLSVNLLNGST